LVGGEHCGDTLGWRCRDARVLFGTILDYREHAFGEFLRDAAERPDSVDFQRRPAQQFLESNFDPIDVASGIEHSDDLL